MVVVVVATVVVVVVTGGGFTAVVGWAVGLGVTCGIEAEHPAVLTTSPTTASLHVPPVSWRLTQKKAPPLHANAPLLYVLRSVMIWTAWAEFVLEPVPPQSEMQ